MFEWYRLLGLRRLFYVFRLNMKVSMMQVLLGLRLTLGLTYNRVPVLVYSPTLKFYRQTFIGFAALEIFDHVGLFSTTLVNDRT